MSSYRQIHQNLSLVQNDTVYAERTCGNYYYFVQEQGTQSHAWSKASALKSWLDDRGLTLAKDLSPHGSYAYQRIRGYYFTESHMDLDAFNAIVAGHEGCVLSNGSYTLAKFVQTGGVTTVHYCNPNVKDRVVLERNSEVVMDMQ